MANLPKYLKSYPEAGAVLACEKHAFYTGSKRPPSPGCSRCWFIHLCERMSGLRPNEREEYLTKLERFASLITRLHELGVDWRPGLTVEDIEHVPEGTPVAAPANAERVF